jgi:hypothetical protein
MYRLYVALVRPFRNDGYRGTFEKSEKRRKGGEE